MKKNKLKHFFQKRQKNKLTLEEQELLQSMIDNGDIDEEAIGEEFSKKELKKHRKKSSKSPIRRTLNNKSKNSKLPAMGFAATFLLMLICLLIYSISFLVAPGHELVAKISVVKGGYELIYENEQLSLSQFPEDVKIGDTYYISDTGNVTKTTKNTIKMVVVKIEDNTVFLKFCIDDMPQFISTADMKKLIYNYRDTGQQQQISKVRISGKILLNRFTLLEIKI